MQVAAGRGGNASTMPAPATKVDVMTAKRAEHRRTITAYHTNLAHSSAIHHSSQPAEGDCIDSPRDTDAAATHSQSQSKSKSKSHADVDDQKTVVDKKGKDSKRSKNTKSAVPASEGYAGGSGNALQHAWVPDIVGSGGTGRFRDENFFVEAERPDRHAEEGYAVAEQGRGALAANVLDLMGEDNAGLLSQRKRKVWDNKKKRYVTLQKVRTHSAALLWFSSF